MRRVRRIRPRLRDGQGRLVGYGVPPEEHKFKPGQSGNPKGRPKGSKNEATILRELLERKIEIRSNGRTRKVTVLEAMHLRFIEDALKGNVKTGELLLKRYAALVSGEPKPDELSDDDHKVLEAFAQRLLAERADSTS